MQMIGREIFDFATRDVVASINDLTQDEAIDYFCFTKQIHVF